MVEHTPVRLDPRLANAAVEMFYNAIDNQTIHIDRWGDTLYVEPSFFSRIVLKPLSGTSFHGRWSPIGNVYVDLKVNANGDVVAADVHYLLGTQNFKR